MVKTQGGAGRSSYVHIVAAAFSNADPSTPSKALRRYDPRSAPTPTLLRDMERACQHALAQLRDLPAGDASPVTHLFGITLPDRDFSVNALHAFYDFKSRLALGQRCQVRFEVGSSDAGAVLFASAHRLLEGAQGPSTALVVAGQEIAPDPRRNVRDFVGQVIDAQERALGLNMIPLGDMIMDALSHRAATSPGAMPVFMRSDALRDLVALWTRRKLQRGRSYRPSQRAGTQGAWNRAQGRWLGSHDMAAASVGACAVILSTDPAVISRCAGERVVRVLGVGEGDARPAVTERPEPLLFFKAMRQSLAALRRATGTNSDFLRASGFAVLHDAFPSIELALLSSLGLSPTDVAQRAAGWWPNPRGGLMACGHAFAASGLVQVAQALHTFTSPNGFEAAPLPRPLSRALSSPMPLHCVTASVGGPLSHVVTTLLESVPPASADVPFEPLPRHRAGGDDDDAFEERAAWVASLAGLYRRGLRATAREGERIGVLEARSRLRLDTITAAMLPLPIASLAQWPAPDRVEYRGRSWSIPPSLRGAVFARLTLPHRDTTLNGGAASARPGSASEADSALRAELDAVVRAAAEAMLVGAADDARPGGASVSELRDELLAALGVPVGFFATDADDPSPHALAVLAVEGEAVDALPIGSVMTLEGAPGALRAATRRIEAREGVVPAWLLAPLDLPTDGALYASLAPAIDAALERLRARPWSRGEVHALRALASEGVARAGAAPHARPPAGLVALVHALVLDPDEDPDALTLALRRWRRAVGSDVADRGAPDHGVRAPLAATCLVDVVGASNRPLAESLGQLHVVARALRRAEAWLAGGRVEHARIADAFCLTAWLPTGTSLDDPTAWTPLLTFARDVYQHCLDHDVGARILVTAGAAMAFREIDSTSVGAVSAAGFALEAALSRCLGPAFDTFFDAPRRDGVMAVIAEEHAVSIGERGDEGAMADAFDRIWRVEGERLRPVPHRGAGARAGGACGSIRGAGGTYVYQLRQRASPRGHLPSRARDVIEP